MEIHWDSVAGEVWDAMAADLPLQQSHPYGAAMAALGARVRRALVIKAGRPVAMAQMLERRGVRLISRGPLWLDGAPRRAVLRRLARWPGVTVATTDGARGLGLMPLVTPVHHAIWRLGDSDMLRRGMAPKWRRALVRAEGAGLRIQRADPAGPAGLVVLSAAATHARERGYHGLPPAFATFWPGEARLWVWRTGGQVAAGMLFLRHGSWATYHAGWADTRARAAGVHRLMLMTAAQALAADGVGTLDLGTICDETAPGLALFKRGTGADIVPLGPTMWVLP